MPVTVIVGGQFGSEGKGKVAHAFAKMRNATVAVRVGGPNSGHTAVDKWGCPQILRQLPTAALLESSICAIPAGAYIDADILFSEMERFSVAKDRVLIDPNAYVIASEDKAAEQESGLRQNIGSTLSGTGAAVIRRIQRKSPHSLALNVERLQHLVQPVRAFLRDRLKRRERVLIEGTQGFGLSLLHTSHYPYATSRDTTASGFVSESGLSPLDVDEVVLVIRSYPIRVAGNSGPLPNEICWSEISADNGSTNAVVEFTSVTGQKRRVARFDPQVVVDAIVSNNPTTLVLNHLDYVDASTRENPRLTDKVDAFVVGIESQIDAAVDFLGYGPATLLPRKFLTSSVRAS